MGQTSSAENEILDVLTEEVVSLTYEKFLKTLGELNQLSKNRVDTDGNQLIFAVKKGSDSSIFWKALVQVACVKLKPDTNTVHNYRLLRLIEFLKVAKTIKCQVSAEEHTQRCNKADLSISTIIAKVSKTNKECCICLDRKQEVILPCTHSFCLPCIEEWNTEHQTCPICRDTLESTDDAWVISEIPQAEEISKEIQSNLMELTDDPNDSSTDSSD